MEDQVDAAVFLLFVSQSDYVSSGDMNGVYTVPARAMAREESRSLSEALVVSMPYLISLINFTRSSIFSCRGAWGSAFLSLYGSTGLLPALVEICEDIVCSLLGLMCIRLSK